MEKDVFIFNLSNTVEYSKDGDFAKTATIELTGPSMENYDLSYELSQLVMRAMMDAQDYQHKFKTTETTAEQAAASVDAKAVKMILMASKSVSFGKVAQVATNLFQKVGTYDGKVSLKPVFFNRMSIIDFTDLVCGYIANFIIPSLF